MLSPLEIDWNDLLILFGKISSVAFFFPIIIALIYRNYWNKSIFMVFIFCSVTFILNFLEVGFIWLTGTYRKFFEPILTFWEIQDTTFLNITFIVKNFLLLSFFYSYIFPNEYFKKNIIRLGQFLTILVVINYIFIEGYKELGVFNPLLNSLFIIILPLIYLWYSQEYALRIPLGKNPYFWISIGLIIPNILSLFYYLSGDYINGADFILYCKFQIGKNLFEILGQILIAIGFYHSYYARFIKTV